MGLVGLSVITGQTVSLPNAYKDPRFNADVDALTGFRTESILIVPVHNRQSEIVGAVELLNKKTGLFTNEDQRKSEQFVSEFTENGLAERINKKKAAELIHEIRRITNCARGSFFVLNRQSGALHTIVSEGLDGREIVLSINLGIAGLVAITGESLNIPDAYADPRFDRSTDEKTGYRTRCILCVPIKNHSGEILGVLETINKKGGTFSNSDMETLQTLTANIAIHIENATLFSEQNRQFKSILKVMAASIDAKDPLTAGHSENVTKYSMGIAKELGFGETEIDVLCIAALLHDYGKIGVDDMILKKPARLTPSEYDVVKNHVRITKNILDKMNFSRKYRTVSLVASCHHELMDGSGYPDGISAEDIPFMSKILTVADVFEALTADRHYRKALTADQAFEELEKYAGVKYDTNIIRALKSFWKKSQTSGYSFEDPFIPY
jgi:HD-GYP domain-containing protein (c-di-GMP phosphodiesterase class II)